MMQDLPEARKILDRLVAGLAGRRLPEDPIALVRRYEDPADQEIVGMIAALFAYGRVRSFLDALDGILDPLGPSPRSALLEGIHRRPQFARRFRYRWTARRPLIGLLEALASMVREEGGLGIGLARRVAESDRFSAGLNRWVSDLRALASHRGSLDRGLRFLLPDPSGTSACKRLHLYLRWMVRADDGIDLGLWSDLLAPADLILPLDAHWVRMAPRLGLTCRRTADGQMAREITEALARLDRSDPLKYDFVICHLGIEGACPSRLTATHCRICPLRPVCPTGRSTAVLERLASLG